MTKFSAIIMKALNFIYKHVKIYPTNKNLKYSYSLSFVLSLLLVIQIISSILLSAFYVPDVSLAASSIDYIMLEISNEFVIRQMHVIFASFIFIVLYLHILKALYYKMVNYNNRFIL